MMPLKSLNSGLASNWWAVMSRVKGKIYVQGLMKA